MSRYLELFTVDCYNSNCVLFQDHEATKAELAKQKEELVAVKKESHKRKKLLIAQQQLIHAGSGSYNKVNMTNATMNLQCKNVSKKLDYLTTVSIYCCDWGS